VLNLGRVDKVSIGLQPAGDEGEPSVGQSELARFSPRERCLTLFLMGGTGSSESAPEPLYFQTESSAQLCAWLFGLYHLRHSPLDTSAYLHTAHSAPSSRRGSLASDRKRDRSASRGRANASEDGGEDTSEVTGYEAGSRTGTGHAPSGGVGLPRPDPGDGTDYSVALPAEADARGSNDDTETIAPPVAQTLAHPKPWGFLRQERSQVGQTRRGVERVVVGK
jgi:hypothetical protein